MGLIQWFQEKVARTFKFGQNNVFFPNLILVKAKAEGSEIKKKKKKKSIILNSIVNLTSND